MLTKIIAGTITLSFLIIKSAEYFTVADLASFLF